MPSPPTFDALWPPWSRERLLHEDADLVVVDKPAGVSTHAPDAPLRDDATSRVRAFLAARDRVDPARVYLGVHASLERDASGVLALAHDRRANGALAAQFARSRGRRRYEAVLTLAPRAQLPSVAGAELTLLDRGAPGRALVAIATEHVAAAELRARLARAGAPVAGEPDVREALGATRVMLHLAELTLTHPTTAREVTFTAPRPDELERFARGEGPAHALTSDDALRAALARACDRRYALGHDDSTDAFRLVNAEGDGVEGITVDRYGAYALVQFYTPRALAVRDRVLDAVAALGARGVYAKFRPKQANTLADTRRDDLAPAHALRGSDAPDEFTVRESGLRYRVRLGDGLSTGLFLDQRENRRAVHKLAAGRTVLNLFAYTAPFTVAAATGGARATSSVDVAPAALAWAARNLEANGVAPDGPHALIRSDVFGWLDGAAARGDRFDLVVLDPPSYATTHDSRFSAEDDYRALAARAIALVAPGGQLLACTNHRGFRRARFRRHLYEAARAAGREPRSAHDRPDPTDFPAASGEEPHLKSVLLALD